MKKRLIILGGITFAASVFMLNTSLSKNIEGVSDLSLSDVPAMGATSYENPGTGNGRKYIALQCGVGGWTIKDGCCPNEYYTCNTNNCSKDWIKC